MPHLTTLALVAALMFVPGPVDAADRAHTRECTGSSSWATASPTLVSMSNLSKPTCGSANRPTATSFSTSGLPSETVSGLSEPGHAGGAFPRPDLHERLERVLEQTRPDLIVACYGMNDGIYHPFTEARFEKYQAGDAAAARAGGGGRCQGAACHSAGLRPDADPVEDAPRGPGRVPAALRGLR